MAIISDIKSWTIVDENIIGTVGETNITLVTPDFHEVEVLEVLAPADVAIIDIGVVGLGNSGGSGGAVDSVNSKTGIVTLNQDEIPDGTTHKQYLATEKTKLAGIATGATANATDANLRDRTTHTGAQAISTVTGLQTAIDAKAPLASPAFTGTPTGITKSHVGLGNVDNTADSGKPVSTAQQTALDGKSNTGHTHAQSDVTGLVTALSSKAATVHTHVATDVTDFSTAVDARIANIIGTAPAALDTLGELSDALGDDADFAGTMTTALAGKASTVHTHATSDVTGLDTSLSGKQASDQDLTDIAALAPTNDDVLQRKAGAWTNRSIAQLKSDLALNNVNNTSDASKPISSATQSALDLKAPLASPAFTGTPTGITKSHVGLGNVDNTADSAKPVSTAQQTALDLKAPLASPAFTGTPTGITKTHVGLGSVDNTADSAKPVSTAQQTALDARFVWADGTTVSNARPSTSSKVIWVGGTTQPTNMATGDLWIKA